MNEEVSIVFSVIMPTYNSAKTIEKSLQSIRMQTFEQSQIEILVIDGGSTDNTREIALKYHAIVLENQEKHPEIAKKIGIEHAIGSWIIEQDSDEVWINPTQFENRWKLIKKNPDISCVLTDKLIPGIGCGICCGYLNRVGDPFGYVVYQNKGSIITGQRKHLYLQKEEGNIYQYKNSSDFPIGDGGCTMLNKQRAYELYGNDIYTENFAATATFQLLKENGYMGCIPEDNIIHYSEASFLNYLKKLRFKIYTNLYSNNMSGFSNRARHSKRLNLKKVSFVLYCLFIIVPLFDSLRLIIKYHDITMGLHFFYTYYVFICLLLELVNKVFHIKKNYSYGKK